MVLTLPIRDVIVATPRARILRIDLAHERFPYAPGQALLIASHDYRPLRPYSITAAPEDAERDGWLELLVGVDLEGRPGPHLLLEPGRLVDVEGPLGRFIFPPEPEASRFIFIAGGTGIAPLRAMMRHALLQSGDRQIGVLYSARTPAEFAYDAELSSLAREQRIELRRKVTRESMDGWTEAAGRISADDLSPLIHDPKTMCFVCGPPAFVAEIPKLLQSLGIPSDLVRVEEY